MSARPGTLRLGTRGSALALAQSGNMADALRARGHEVELVVIRTQGDVQQGVPFAAIGQPGVFVRELERALMAGEVDLCVHSYKDLPSRGPSELVIAAIPEREDERDVLFVRAEAHLPDAEGLPLDRGAKVGTASARREALLRDLRPDVVPTHLRGNVPTRLEKLQAGEADAILLAAAGVARLEASGEELPTDGLVRLPLAPETFVPAPSQGALALQVRATDEATRAAVGALDDPVARRCVEAERTLLARVEGNCTVPFGAWCCVDPGPGDDGPEGDLLLRAAHGTPRGLLRARFRGDDPVQLAETTWRHLAAALEESR